MWIEICAYYCMRKRVLLSSLMARYELKYVLILEYEFERLSLEMFFGTSFFIYNKFMYDYNVLRLRRSCA